MTDEITIEDTKFGTKFCYCASHLSVHATGWCAVGTNNKFPIHAETLDEARLAYEKIKTLIKGEYWMGS